MNIFYNALNINKMKSMPRLSYHVYSVMVYIKYESAYLHMHHIHKWKWIPEIISNEIETFKCLIKFQQPRECFSSNLHSIDVQQSVLLPTVIVAAVDVNPSYWELAAKLQCFCIEWKSRATRMLSQLKFIRKMEIEMKLSGKHARKRWGVIRERADSKS